MQYLLLFHELFNISSVVIDYHSKYGMHGQNSYTKKTSCTQKRTHDPKRMLR